MSEVSRMAPPVGRRQMHQRIVRCDGYLREDGLWEVEARLRDTKPFAYEHFARGTLPAGSAVHDMALRLSVDDEMTVVAIDSEMVTTPVFSCQDVLPRTADLVGIRLVAGWRKTVRERIGLLHSCTHLMDLMTPAVTTLYQTMGMGKEPEGRNAVREARKTGLRPFYLGGCYSWRTDGPVVRKFFPDFATKPPEQE